MSKKKALVLMYPLNEECEISIPVAVLRRGGIETYIVSPDMEPNVGARQTKTLPDMSLKEALKKGPYDAVVLSGGQFGWQALSDSKEVGDLLKDQEKSGRIIASICTSPIALMKHKIFYGKKITSHPLVEDIVREDDDYIYKYDNVVVDGKLITTKGPITTYPFAIALLEMLTDRAKAKEVAAEMLMDYNYLSANLLS